MVEPSFVDERDTGAIKGGLQLAQEANESKEVIERFNIQIWHRISLSLLIVLMAVIGALGWSVNEIGNINSTVNTIRTSQVYNTNQSNIRANCQNNTFNDLLFDVRLIFAGDKNPADYKVAPEKC